MPVRKDIRSILIIGSGPIVVGQACEFDYSGTQAVQALKEEGFRVILINPNPATVMTGIHLADATYLEPVSCEFVEQVIKIERPDALLTTMGGQTALNLTMELHRKGILTAYGVQIIGAGISSIELAEDRRRFKEVVASLGLESARSVTVKSVGEALLFKNLVGLPLILRPSFTLGGVGGSIVRDDELFVESVSHALQASPVHEVLVEQSLIGWKELELEVMRDKHDNAIVVCSIENVDPMGIHTGDSITVAPIQTLSDDQYQRMRTAAIDILRAVGVDCGGSNVQFALEPDGDRMIVVEMNPRVSRSSALASKATGFPIARCSAKLAVGMTLDEVLNEITGATASCFEPALDYVAIKVPRFELEKFPLGIDALGTQMKSIGEALALGRTFCEALNKAIRSTERNIEGLVRLEEIEGYAAKDIETILTHAHPLRLFAAYSVLYEQGPKAIPSITQATGYDRWFLCQMLRQVQLEKQLINEGCSLSLLNQAKRMALSDTRIARLTGLTAQSVADLRSASGIVAVRHVVDTCAGEFVAKTPYCYQTYGEQDELEPLGPDSFVIVASGPNRIGQGLEFDTCCTMASMALRAHGMKTIMINSNPETVSTDYNISDRLYIEPLTEEHVIRILECEQTRKVVLQLGGQTPLNMVGALTSIQADIVGTSAESISIADDRTSFSQLLSRLGLQQSKNYSALSLDDVFSGADFVGYPVLIRPSHVLGGRKMAIAYNESELAAIVSEGIVVSKDSPLLIDHFLEDAFEYDLDAVSDGSAIYIGGILQHIEAAGIHSGDSAAVFPPYKSNPEILEQMRQAALALARALSVKGFINIQFAVKDNQLYVIEANPRASRTVPFISKTSNRDLVDIAVRVWLGQTLVDQHIVAQGQSIAEGYCTTGWAIKEAVFSFDRFANIDVQLGPEMRSTGEVVGIGESFGEAFAKSQISAGNELPQGGRVCISVNKRDRQTIIPIAKALSEMGFELAATRGTARDLFEAGLLCETVLKVHEGHPNIVDHMRSRRFSLIINTPMGMYAKQSDDDIRTMAMRLNIPYTTTTSAAAAAVDAIRYLKGTRRSVHKLQQP
ncbi:MAG: carbamoyl-phosphate synthase large subunit [Sphaerochaetaceae bacterium]|jgi:carbamoyl-phosphate synthase large subunit|nr:carbamoyl-phosphate synthase large subunit [Sphaerochaetaceae bacterium]